MLKQSKHRLSKYGFTGTYGRLLDRRKTRRTARALLGRFMKGEDLEDLLFFQAPKRWLD